MSCLVETFPCPVLWAPFTPSVSEESREIAKSLEEARKHNAESVTLGWKDALMSTVIDIQKDCSMADWDSYGAAPISEEVKNLCITSILQLPDNIQSPDIVPEPTGDLALEWYDDNKNVLSISIGQDKIIYVSSFVGGYRYSGEEPIRDELPKPTIDLLSKYFSKGG